MVINISINPKSFNILIGIFVALTITTVCMCKHQKEEAAYGAKTS